jgi:hypothetical protein
MHSEILYSDKLVLLTEEYLMLQNYYMYFGARRVDYKDIGVIEVITPTLSNGKYRVAGTGDFRTWFPMDWKRHTRDKLFVLVYRESGKRIGFTAEDSGKVTQILQQKGLIKAV